MYKTETTSGNKLQNLSSISEQPSSDIRQSQFSIKKLLLWTTGIAVGITVWTVSREKSTVDPIPALLNVSAYIVVVSGIAAIVRYSQKPLDARQSQAVSLDVWLPTAMNGAILVFLCLSSLLASLMADNKQIHALVEGITKFFFSGKYSLFDRINRAQRQAGRKTSVFNYHPGLPCWVVHGMVRVLVVHVPGLLGILPLRQIPFTGLQTEIRA